MLIVFFIVMLGILFFNIIYYIPNKLKEHEEKRSLYFEEINIRMNRLERMIEDINKKLET